MADSIGNGVVGRLLTSAHVVLTEGDRVRFRQANAGDR